jgi:uncharacterized membrane protein HdeD (DUF308 family)
MSEEAVKMALIQFLASPTGRIVRVVAGVLLVIVGVAVVSNFVVLGVVIVVVGLVPLLAGLLDVCVFAPLFGMSFKGKEIRSARP